MTSLYNTTNDTPLPLSSHAPRPDPATYASQILPSTAPPQHPENNTTGPCLTHRAGPLAPNRFSYATSILPTAQ